MTQDYSLLAPETLLQLEKDVGAALLPELVALFISDSTETLAKLQSALQAHDTGELVLLAHTLKSVCATYGAARCHHEARALEMAARSGEWQGMEEGVHRLRGSLPATMQALDLWCRTPRD
jgi:FOG: HPt domain